MRLDYNLFVNDKKNTSILHFPLAISALKIGPFIWAAYDVTIATVSL